MKFIEVAKAFDEIEQESSRLKITQLLSELLKKATPNQAAIISYMSLGELHPSYIGTKFNFAEKSMLKVLVKLLDKSEETIRKHASKLGDLGLVAQKTEIDISYENELSVTQVAKELKELETISGEGAVERKEKKILNLLKNLNALSAKYVSRIILGKLRLGFSDMTLLDAFSWMQKGDKSIRKELEEAYNVSADIGHIIKVLKEEGLEGIKKIDIMPGTPLRPAAAERLSDAKSIVQKLGECIAQPKLDGFRLQVHINKKKTVPEVHFFSRNLQDMSEMFPDLKEAVLDLPVKTLVCEGEAIAYDIETGTFLPFQETVKRKRKYEIEKMAVEFPLKLYLFDLLYLNGESFLQNTHKKRRRELLNIFRNIKLKKQQKVLPIDEQKIESAKDLEKYFNENITSGLEGVVVKKIDAVYQAGKRNFNWIKLKRQESGELKDTIDCVILGYYSGKGKRADFGIGAFLVGAFNKKEDRFETVAKIGTGLSDEEWKELKKKCDRIKMKNKPKNVECVKELYPSVWVIPEIVCEIRADEITLSPLHTAGETKEHQGMALRFPRFIGYRKDKSPEESTTIKELEKLYSLQFEDKKKKKTKKRTKNQKLDNFIINIF
ncbi:ATP-dependent DNA ligase [Candidatus Dependentiae bacterium]|nr:ATP-dependent DNA ligase [Candidatus Dependentiae bacterium]